jgi:hypothetical protein
MRIHKTKQATRFIKFTRKNTKIPPEFKKYKKFIVKSLDMDDPIKAAQLDRAHKLFKKYYAKRGVRNNIMASKYLLFTILLMSIMFDIGKSRKITYKVSHMGYFGESKLAGMFGEFIPGNLLSGPGSPVQKGIKSADQLKTQGYLTSYNVIEEIKKMAKNYKDIKMNDIVGIAKKIKYSSDGWLKQTDIAKLTIFCLKVLESILLV